MRGGPTQPRRSERGSLKKWCLSRNRRDEDKVLRSMCEGRMLDQRDLHVQRPSGERACDTLRYNVAQAGEKKGERCEMRLEVWAGARMFA